MARYHILFTLEDTDLQLAHYVNGLAETPQAWPSKPDGQQDHRAEIKRLATQPQHLLDHVDNYVHALGALWSGLDARRRNLVVLIHERDALEHHLQAVDGLRLRLQQIRAEAPGANHES